MDDLSVLRFLYYKCDFLKLPKSITLGKCEIVKTKRT